VLEAAWFGMPKMPNCLVQQLMPTSGLTTRGDLIGRIICDFRGKKKTLSTMAGMKLR
jgi:hypothetical protein